MLETTLANQWADTRRDRYGTAYQRFLLTSVPNFQPGETAFLGLMPDLPHSGMLLAEVLAQVAPDGANINGEVADFNQAIQARRRALAGQPGGYLYTSHAEDPNIGSLYQDFMTQVYKWKRSFLNSQYDGLFLPLRNTHFVYDLDAYADQVASQWQLNCQKGPSKLILGPFFEAESAVLSVFPEEFASHIEAAPNFWNGAKSIKPGDKERVLDRYSRTWHQGGKRYDYLNRFLPTLSQEQLRQLVIGYQTRDRRWGKSLVDIRNQRAELAQEVVLPVQFVDAEQVWIGNDQGSRVLIEARMDLEGRFHHQIREYQLAPPTGPYLLDLWAWARNREGDARFLSQAEAESLLKNVGWVKYRFHADVMLGRVNLASRSSELIDRWPKKLPLTLKNGKKTRLQKIAGAQVGVWVSMDDHPQQLLSTALIARLEKSVT